MLIGGLVKCKSPTMDSASSKLGYLGIWRSKLFVNPLDSGPIPTGQKIGTWLNQWHLSQQKDIREQHPPKKKETNRPPHNKKRPNFFETKKIHPQTRKKTTKLDLAFPNLRIPSSTCRSEIGGVHVGWTNQPTWASPRWNTKARAGICNSV